ncbi:MAG: nuclear transport factor 2 family protein [Rhodoferax sp.]|nr:nuclear transport factor 2 family protein [Rhodoferax sp.]MCF8208282.1 nuclear transport factor 2 family protein [Rhodoferax sp.]
MKMHKWSMGACLAVLLVACGGGSDDVNLAPIANAGTNQSGVPMPWKVVLDGSRSSDPDGDKLMYKWTLTSQPANSKATLSWDFLANASFIPDKEGTYIATLVVNDGLASSQPATVSIAVKPTGAIETDKGNAKILKQIFDNNDAKKFDDNLKFFSQNFVGYGSGFPTNGMINGPQAMVDYFRGTEGDAFPGGSHEIHHLLTQGEYLSVDFSYTASFSGVLNIYQKPYPPTNQPITFHYNMLLRFVDGVVTEGYWFGEDSFMLLAQLGIIYPVFK